MASDLLGSACHTRPRRQLAKFFLGQFGEIATRDFVLPHVPDIFMVENVGIRPSCLRKTFSNVFGVTFAVVFEISEHIGNVRVECVGGGRVSFRTSPKGQPRSSLRRCIWGLAQ